MLVSIIVPVFFMACVAACIVAPGFFRSRDQAQMQETLRTAISKGANLPPELIESLQNSAVVRVPPTRQADLRRGIVLLSVGIGLALIGAALWAGIQPYDDEGAYISGLCVACAGAIPGMIGIAYLILWATGSKKTSAADMGRAPTLGQS
jgi:hypothetical protein